MTDKRIKRYTRESEYFGLVDSIEYKFNESGFIDWRSLIPTEHLFPNVEKLKLLGKDPNSNVNDLDDSLILVKLAGIKFLAKVRGYNSVAFEVNNLQDNVVAKCSIKWIPNYEDPDGVEYQEVASCNIKNSDDFSLKFAETIACNRAFVRCVRNFLNINIVGEEEIEKKNRHETSSSESKSSLNHGITPQAILLKSCKNKNMSLEDIVDFCKQNDDTIDNIEDISKSEGSFVKNLTAKSAKKLLKIVKTV